MNLKTDKSYTIFKEEKEEKTYYKISLSKKDRKTDKLIFGTLNCRFKKDVILEDKQKIKIKDGWLDFYINSKNITIPYIFVNEFELVNE